VAAGVESRGLDSYLILFPARVCRAKAVEIVAVFGSEIEVVVGGDSGTWDVFISEMW
jgi:hypothetical protein